MQVSFIDKLKSKLSGLFTQSNWVILKGLTWANFKASDYGTVFGIIWSLLNPITMLAVMYFIFRTRFGVGIKDYPLYILIGIVTVNFFIVATTYMIKNFSLNRRIILNSMIPRESLIASQFIVHLYKFLIEIILCFFLSVFFGFFSWYTVFLLIPLCIAYILFVAGAGLMLALLYCFVKDIEHLWMLGVRIFYFVTPIFFRMKSICPEARVLVYYANPLTPFVLAIRGLLMQQLNGGDYIYAVIFGLLFFTLSYCIFIIFENFVLERA